MHKFRRIGRALLFPHPWIIAVLAPVSTALLVYAFVGKNAADAVVYGSYFLSAYALTVVCARLPWVFGHLSTLKSRNPYLSRYTSSLQLRFLVSLYTSLVSNVLYALLQMVSALLYRSGWYAALAGYYGILAAIRGLLLHQSRRTHPSKMAQYRTFSRCGMLLLAVHSALSVIVYYIVRQQQGIAHHSILAIAMAAFTFYSVITCTIQAVRYRRYENPLVTAGMIVSFAASLVSVLPLETAMLAAFDAQQSPEFRYILTAATGSAICCAILILSVLMIVHASIQIKTLQKEDKFHASESTK